jgi:hypothetical protein
MWLVKTGHGLALVDEGRALLSELITKPIAGVTWTAETALVYRKQATHVALASLARGIRNKALKLSAHLKESPSGINQLRLELHS